jgi:hypothetical protein
MLLNAIRWQLAPRLLVSVRGVMIVTRGEVEPFQESDLDLMKGFADQAVIAIENARLLSELRQRTEEVGKLNQHLNSASPIKLARSSAWADCAASCRRRSPI